MAANDKKRLLEEQDNECVGTCFSCIPACERRKPGEEDGKQGESSTDEAPKRS